MPDENLTARAGVRVRVSVNQPTGRGARDPNVLLRAHPAALDGLPLSAFLDYRPQTYDTYDGHNQAAERDWYALHFPEAATCNCIEMTMECPNRDGGWWTSLDVEAWDEAAAAWTPVSGLAITPPYPFADEPHGRRPYETYALTFDAVTARALRLIGWPGGLAQFTSLAHLAAFRRDVSRWNPASLPTPPTPYIFHLIPANTIWDLSESLMKLTGLAVNIAYMDHYLDAERYARWWRRISRNYQGEPELWQLLGMSIGWDAWNRIEYSDSPTAKSPGDSYVRVSFHRTVGRAVAPIVVDGRLLAEMESHSVIIADDFDEAWHRRYADQQGIAWASYAAAVARSPHLSLEQLEGAATLLGMIANTIANLAHRNLALQRELDGVRRASAERRALERREIVRRAIDFMQDHLETPVTITDVARAVALTPTYFGVIFREQIGRNPVDYLIDLRIERAKDYLIHTDMSVMDVCVALGYDPSYFSRLFKRRTGLTPGQYARRAPHREGAET
jgi:AraC-like DNA-binding protein